MKNNKRRKKYLGSAFQKKMLFLVFVAAVIPAAIIAVCMYYLIFSMLAWQMVIPEAIAYNLMPVLKKVNLVIALSVPIILVLLWLVALELSHRVAGPLYRMEKELDEIISGAKKGPLKLRKKDEFKILADKINKLIAK
jgi:signal transduction histidine kinase